jgi:glutathione S-transferase
MYTLFWEKGSGSIVVQALMEELQVAYQRRYVDMGADEHLGAGYRRHNPAGMVPALTLPDGQTMGESAAILLYLGEQCSDTRLVPPAGDAARPRFLFWLVYMATTGYMGFGAFAHPERYTRDANGLEAVSDAMLETIDRFFEVLERGIAGDPWILAGGFSALDIYLTMLAGWYPQRDALFRRCPKVGALCAAVEARPAYRKVMADHA